MPEICPQKIIRTTALTTDGFNPSVIQLLDSSKTANLERIICNIHEPVLLRLLVCKEEKNREELSSCPYPDHINREATIKACCDSDKSLAHIYVRHEEFNPVARSCVIVFVEGKYLNQTNELLNVFQNTVNWLNIAQEKPYFYVFRYGQPGIGLTTIDVSKKLNKIMKETFEGYSKNEDICLLYTVGRGTKPLIMNCFKKFMFNAS